MKRQFVSLFQSSGRQKSARASVNSVARLLCWPDSANKVCYFTRSFMYWLIYSEASSPLTAGRRMLPGKSWGNNFFLVANCKDYRCAVRRRDLPQCCLNCTKFDKLILRKITKIVASRCDILKPRCIKFDFGWGSVPDPAGVLQRSPDPYSWI